jgi:hypothetical protein
MAQCRGEIGKVIYDRPARRSILNDVIEVLNTITTLEWGWKAGRFDALYITSGEFPIKIGVNTSKKMTKKDVRKGTKTTFDIVVENNSRDDFSDSMMWAAAVTIELRDKLLDNMNKIKDDILRDSVTDTLQGLTIPTESDYAVLMEEASQAPTTGNTIHDVWMYDCLRK